jgi:hypothetical protein
VRISFQSPQDGGLVSNVYIPAALLQLCTRLTSRVRILFSRPFKFFIGMDALEILIYGEAIASQSPALNKLMRGEVSEGKTGEVT